MTNAVKTHDLPGQAAQSILITLNISVYTSRKKDKQTSAEVQQAKGAGSSQAVSSYKNLFAECAELKSITSYAQDSRNWFNKVTRVWGDNGQRQLKVSSFYNNVDKELSSRAARYKLFVDAFLRIYNVQVSKQAFMLGSLFNREEFPTVEEVASKFAFRFTTEPMPLSGHFCVDAEQDAINELVRRYEEEMQRRVSVAQSDLFERVRKHVEHIHERMVACLAFDPDAVEETRTVDEFGVTTAIDIKKPRKPKLYDTLLDSALEQCNLLQDLNIGNDPVLESMRTKLYNAIVSTDIDSLKKSPELQGSMKKKMEDILSDFDF